MTKRAIIISIFLLANLSSTILCQIPRIYEPKIFEIKWTSKGYIAPIGKVPLAKVDKLLAEISKTQKILWTFPAQNKTWLKQNSEIALKELLGTNCFYGATDDQKTLFNSSANSCQTKHR